MILGRILALFYIVSSWISLDSTVESRAGPSTINNLLSFKDLEDYMAGPEPPIIISYL